MAALRPPIFLHCRATQVNWGGTLPSHSSLRSQPGLRFYEVYLTLMIVALAVRKRYGVLTYMYMPPLTPRTCPVT